MSLAVQTRCTRYRVSRRSGQKKQAATKSLSSSEEENLHIYGSDREWRSLNAAFPFPHPSFPCGERKF